MFALAGKKAISNIKSNLEITMSVWRNYKVINVKSTQCDAHFVSKVTQTSLIFKKSCSFTRNAHLIMLLKSNNDLGVMDNNLFSMFYG